MNWKLITFTGIVVLILLGSMWFLLKDDGSGSQSSGLQDYLNQLAQKGQGEPKTPAETIAAKQWYEQANVGGNITPAVEYWNWQNIAITTNKKADLKAKMISDAKQYVQRDPFGETVNAFFWNNNFEIWFLKIMPGELGDAVPTGDVKLYWWA